MIGCQSNESNVGKIYANVDDLIADVRKDVSELSTQEFNELMNSETPYTLLDIRLKEEHDRGYIPGSVSIPRGVLEFRIASEKVWDEEGLYVPEKDELLILYCKMSNRSPLAALSLRQLGYSNVKVINGGWKEWHDTYPEIMEDNIEEDGNFDVVVQEESSGGC